MGIISSALRQEAQPAMNLFKTSKRETVVNVIDGVLSLIVLALSVEMFKAWTKETGQLIQISTVFFMASTAYRFIRAFLHRKNSRVDFIRDIIGGCLLLAGMILLIVSGDNANNITVVGLLYFLSVVVDRIASVIKKPTPLNIVFNIAVVVVLVLLGPKIIVIVIIRIVNALQEILGIAYSQMKMDIFWKVVRKTNAAEILFGMLLLIIAFSLVLPILEEDIPDFSSALWYSFAIISTIGFGDVAAVSILGRLLSAILGICGLMVVSVVMSIAVNFYNETKDLEE